MAHPDKTAKVNIKDPADATKAMVVVGKAIEIEGTTVWNGLVQLLSSVNKVINNDGVPILKCAKWTESLLEQLMHADKDSGSHHIYKGCDSLVKYVDHPLVTKPLLLGQEPAAPDDDT